MTGAVREKAYELFKTSFTACGLCNHFLLLLELVSILSKNGSTLGPSLVSVGLCDLNQNVCTFLEVLLHTPAIVQ